MKQGKKDFRKQVIITADILPSPAYSRTSFHDSRTAMKADLNGSFREVGLFCQQGLR
jgi:hypothetical protein